MSSLPKADQLLQWAEQQQLNAKQLEQVPLPLHASVDDWLDLANKLLLFVAGLLLFAALVFFFAYNWPLMHHLSKLALAGSAVLITGTAAILSTADSAIQRVALFSGSLLTGALLALIGQIYQTGADIWQLFAAWAALITPLVLLSKSRASYLLWFVILELALWRYLDSRSRFWLLDSAQMLSLFCLLNLLLLLFAEFALPRLGVCQHKPLCWLAGLALLLPLSIGAIMGVWEAEYRINLICYIMLAGVMALWYYRLQRDLLIFALLLFSAITVSTVLLARLMGGAGGFFLFNLLALYVIACSAGATLWLKRLLREAQYGV
ncbi:DUF2157 domain-containing protein [Rheinheimera fenheensis]|uniref:DUF2157 domain-containing protein n=1 Tax=Rheinheimera fenheensis TaxID=3152295 RepID=UPI003260DFC0